MILRVKNVIISHCQEGNADGTPRGVRPHQYGDRSRSFVLRYARDFPEPPEDFLSVYTAHWHRNAEFYAE